MPPERKPGGGVIRLDALPLGWRREKRPTLAAAGIEAARCKRQDPLGSCDFPKGKMSIAAQGCKRPGCRERLKIATIERRALGKILHARERSLQACGNDTGRACLGQGFDESHAQTQGRLGSSLDRLQSAVPVARCDAHGPDLSAMLARIDRKSTRLNSSHSSSS